MNKKFKLACFDWPHWVIGKINEEIGKRIGENVVVLNWSQQYDISYIQELVKNDYLFLTSSPGLLTLLYSYQIPPDRIHVVTHDDDDFACMQNAFIQANIDLNHALNSIRGYAVPSQQLVPSILGKRLNRIADVVQMGINVDDWTFRVRDKIEVLGACGATCKPANTGHADVKRGRLIDEVGAQLGLTIARTNCQLPPGGVREWFDGVDLNMMAGVIEGNPMSPYEAAACGIPTIGTHCGSWAQIAYNNASHTVPTADRKYVAKAVELIKYYKNNPQAYKELSLRAREESLKYDWNNTINTWYEWFDNPSKDLL